jgi:dihydropteroate synthase
MAQHNPRFISIDSLATAKKEIQHIGSDPKSLDIMAPKAVFKVIRLEQVMLQDAIIIKQDMLSLGGEVAIPRDAFELKKNTADILLMGTVAQLQQLVGKLQRHYPRIQVISLELAVLLETILKRVVPKKTLTHR